MAALPIIEWYICCGNYRKFIVLARTKNLAMAQFNIASQQGHTRGFYEKDITRVFPKSGWKQHQKEVESAR